jgi:hypothetical protein
VWGVGGTNEGRDYRYVLHEFEEQLSDLALRCYERVLATRRRAVHFPPGSSGGFLGRSEVSLLFQPVQDWVQSSRTDPISVPCKLLDHAEAENRFLGRVMQDVEADKAGVQVAVVAVRRLKRISHSGRGFSQW